MIMVTYRSIDGVSAYQKFKTIEAARRYAHWRVGPTPEIGSNYAVSGDGVGKVTVRGATLQDLFPATVDPPKPAGPCNCEVSQVYGGDCVHTMGKED